MYCWSNSNTGGASFGWREGGGGGCTPPVDTSVNYVIQGRDFYTNTVAPNYAPYTLPHPLRSQVIANDPQITIQPQNQTVFVGQTALFTLSATGQSTLSYQWKTNGVNAGTNGPALALPNCLLAWSGMTVLCTVSDANGNETSQQVTLTVNPDPNITSQPTDQTVTSPATATFAVTASGQTTLSYQWYKGGVAIVGAAAASYTTPATTSGDDGTQFYVVVTDTAGSLQSSTATLHVNAGQVQGGGGSAAKTYGKGTHGAGAR